MSDMRILFEEGLERRSARERLTAILGEKTVADLHERSDWRGAFAVASCWCAIALLLTIISGSLSLLGWAGLLIAIPALFLLGGRLLGLAILAHEASHRTLFRNANLNDLVGDWLCAAPVYLDLEKYRRHHAQHHVHTGTEKDVDLPLIEGFPTSRSSMLRKFLRDISGQTGIKSLIGFAMMNAEMIKWNVTGVVEWLPSAKNKAPEKFRLWLINSRRTLLFHGLFAALVSLAGHPELYAIWWAGYLFAYPFCLRVRAIAEHAVTERTGDMLKNTRTTRAGLISRALFAPFNVNYHIEHHALVSVPFWQLPALHALLQQHRVLPPPPGYLDVMKLASAQK